MDESNLNDPVERERDSGHEEPVVDPMETLGADAANVDEYLKDDDLQDTEPDGVADDDEGDHFGEKEDDGADAELHGNDFKDSEITETAETTVSTESIVEALLFSSSGPLSIAKLAKAMEREADEVEQCIRDLNTQYETQGRAFWIVGVANGYQMMTRSAYFPYIQRLIRTKTSDKLTQAGLETLAIIAYKQPIIRADIEAVRGVQSGSIIRNLLERRLVRVVGRDNRLGHPMLYGTSKRFLEIFGLKSLKELPSIEELKAF
ncbi:MAG: SMC-Scp complex subunit ScpB [Planctomycetota bacterium]